MVLSFEIIFEIVENLKKYNLKYLVVDLVMIFKSGYYLLKLEVKENLIKYLILFVYIIILNILEVEEIIGIKIYNVDDMKRVGEEIL